MAGRASDAHEALNQLPRGIEWESSDEAYDPDGEEIDPEEVSQARMAYFARVAK